MSMHPLTDLGNHVKAVYLNGASDAGTAALITAGGAGDATEVTSATVTRVTTGGEKFESCVLLLAYNATLGASETISFTIKVQESDDDSTYDAAVTLQAATVANTGAGDKTGVVEFVDTNFHLRKQYVQYLITPDLSAGATDTATAEYVAILGGSKVSADA